ncbi:MAG: biotin transporter BioY [Caldimicrobium thiodismutans]|uniref:Biotin transporter n=1 Tax=Caldimicrobium thiodismutans TaxID=1653476 RepID=A0A2N7PKY7_9BACT|nr:MAG: biotin transporter BioY [Caldimicrobium thiodismutans]
MKNFEKVLDWKRALLVKGATVFSYTLLLALLSQIRIPLPFTPIPLTLQTFGVLLIGYYLGAKAGFFSILLYLLLGAAGLPFFSGVKGGFLVLSGPTGGYLLGFLAGVYLIGKAKETGLLQRPIYALLLGLMAHLLIYFFGVIWFVSGYYKFFTTSYTLREILTLTVFPFLPWDLIKSFLFAGFIVSEKRVKEVFKR